VHKLISTSKTEVIQILLEYLNYFWRRNSFVSFTLDVLLEEL